MSLAIFDLDNTLIGGDSDHLWGQYLVDQGIVDKALYEEANSRFYENYKQGTLDIDEFLRFALQPLAAHDPADLDLWRLTFVNEKIKPILLPAAHALVESHRRKGDTLLIVTATNRFVTAPVAELYGIDHLIATTPEFRNGRYTGLYEGIPTFQQGKVTRLNEWLERNQKSLDGSWFYSDSHNDLPLLEIVSNPVAVDPDEKLHSHASRQGWPIITLREPV